MLLEAPALDDVELGIIGRIDGVRHRLRHELYEPRRWDGLLRRFLEADSIRASTGIEGHHVSRDDAVASVDGAERFEASDPDWAALVGYRHAMGYVIQISDDPHFSYSDGLDPQPPLHDDAARSGQAPGPLPAWSYLRG